MRAHVCVCMPACVLLFALWHSRLCAAATAASVQGVNVLLLLLQDGLEKLHVSLGVCTDVIMH